MKVEIKLVKFCFGFMVIMMLCCLAHAQDNLLSSGWTAYIDIKIDDKTASETGVIDVKKIEQKNIKHAFANTRYEIDIAKLAGKVMPKHYALLTTTIKCPEKKKVRFGCSADWWMQWRINGKIVYDTLKTGNRVNPTSITDNVFDVDLKKGDNHISVLVKSGNGGWKVIAAAGDVLKDVPLTIKKRIDDYKENPLDFTFNELAKESYKLPELLVDASGKVIKTKEEWLAGRRGEVLKAMSEYIYGALPEDIGKVSCRVVETDNKAVDGLASFSKVNISITRNNTNLTFPLYLFTPNNGEKKHPVFLHINHRFKNIDGVKYDNPYWPVKTLIERGYATVSFAPRLLADDITGKINSLLDELYPESFGKRDSWGTISIWAYGAMRVADYLVSRKDIDADKLAVVGHSRSGKAAAWTGANDERFSLICANGSGCTGMALARRYRGETIKNINKNYPGWFNNNYKEYNNNEDALPIDQHMLVSLIAPRALAVGCGVDDSWADPKGEFFSLCNASPVFELFSQKCFNLADKPKLDKALRKGKMSFHVRKGGHGLRTFDWLEYITFADLLFGAKQHR